MPTRRRLLAGAAAAGALALGGLPGPIRHPARAATAFATGTGGLPAGGWQSPALTDHPLAGRIWDARAGRFVARAEALTILGRARFALLGEKHDNADHHRLQAEILAELGERARFAAVVFEMLTDAQADALPAPDEPADLAALGPALGWEARGWYDWAIYRPVFEAARAAGLHLAPGSPARETLRAVAGDGAAIEGPLATMLTEPLPEPARKGLAETIEAAHCGHAPADMLGPMIRAQRFKDAHLADRLLRAESAHGAGAFLIAGGGHARRDWGAPLYLARRGVPASTIRTVLFTEVRAEAESPAAYAAGGAEGDDDAPVADLVWFTPRVDLKDPCEAFREQLETMGDHGGD